jgi:hypothetical protein
MEGEDIRLLAERREKEDTMDIDFSDMRNYYKTQSKKKS